MKNKDGTMELEITCWLENNRKYFTKRKKETIIYWAKELSRYGIDIDKFCEIDITDKQIAFLALLKEKYENIYEDIINDMMDNINDFYGGERTFEAAFPYDINLPKDSEEWTFSFEVGGAMEILHAHFVGWKYTGTALSD
jgi:hypothetical protein